MYQNVNWIASERLSCSYCIPAVVYLCVDPLIVNPNATGDSGFVTATLTNMFKSCNGQYTYTFQYNDDQLVDGYALTNALVKGVLCKDCLTDFILANGGGVGCCCVSWSKELCFTQPTESLLFFRSDSVGELGFSYTPFTWSPYAAFSGDLQDFTGFEKSSFNSDYTIAYSYHGGVSSEISTIDYTDPLNPVEGSPVALIDGSDETDMYSIAVDPTTDILYGLYTYDGGPNLSFGTIDPETGAITDIADSTLGTTYRTIGFNQAGQLYIFDSTGATKTINKASGAVGSTLWTFGTGEYVLYFLGFAGTNYGVTTYNSGTYKSYLLNLATGVKSETETDIRTGMFYLPEDPPIEQVPFIRVFHLNCEGTLVIENRDLLTGEIIELPDDTVVSVCSGG